MVHTKNGRTTSGWPRELSTGRRAPMVNGPLWSSLISVSLFFGLMMDVKDVEGKLSINPDAMRFRPRRNVSVMV